MSVAVSCDWIDVPDASGQAIPRTLCISSGGVYAPNAKTVSHSNGAARARSTRVERSLLARSTSWLIDEIKRSRPWLRRHDVESATSARRATRRVTVVFRPRRGAYSLHLES